jgi:aminodeoxyfutalosine synthase
VAEEDRHHAGGSGESRRAVAENQEGLEAVSVTLLDELGERIERGESLDERQAAGLLQANDLIAVGALADEVRRKLHGSRTTFVRVLEVHVDAVPSAVPDGVSFGELRVVGKPASVEAAVRAVSAARALGASAPLTAFSLADVSALGSSSRTLDAIARELRDAGLDGIAEVPLDALPNAAADVTRARAAGLRLMRLTVHALAEGQRVPTVVAARDLQAAVGGFRAFAPLPRVISVSQPTTGYDDVKLVALARLVVTNIESIQVEWPLYGPKLAQVALIVGADDVDGVAVDAGTLGTRRSPLEEIRGNIRAAAQDPLERDGLFEVLPG